MNKLVRNFIGYKVKLCKLNSDIMNKNKIKDKDCFKGNMDKKQNFDILINEIRDVNKSLKHWLQEDDFVNTEDMLPKVLNLKTISVKGSNFFSDCELSDLVAFDNRLTSELMSVSFEKDVLLKKKIIALKELDIDKAILYVKLIGDVDGRINKINAEIKNIENVFNDKHESYVNLYEQFVSDMLTSSINRDKNDNKVNYNMQVVNQYRVNKISELILNYIDDDCYDLFEDQEIKRLLGNCYFQIKQKVNKYVGANS